MNRTEVQQINQEIGTDALTALRLSIRRFYSAHNTAQGATFLKLLDAGLVDGNGFPTPKGKALEAYLAS